jgi:UDP-N-acetylglucosamine acyltransferase
MADISPYSIVEKGAKLARNVRVGPFCYIGPNVTIGAGTVIESNVTIVGNTTLGEQNRVFPMAVIGTTHDGDDVKGRCVIGNANSIREHVAVYAGTTKKPTKIGQNNLVMIASQVGAGTTIGDHGIFANCTHIAAGAVIEDYVRTSAFTFVAEGVTVGAYTFVAGFVQVDHDAPPYAMLQGFPYRIRGVNSHNLKACGFGEADIRELKRVFRDLFNSDGNLDDEVLARLRKDRKANPYVKMLLKYCTNPTSPRESDDDDA